jgi:hypothetical protein
MTQTAQSRWRKAVVMVYPVPARDQVTFTYQICCPIKVSVDLYTFAGERVIHLEEEKLAASAQDAFTVMAVNDLAPGVYIANLVVRKMDGTELLRENKKLAIVK